MTSADAKLQRLIIEQAAEWHVAQTEGSLDSEQSQAFVRWLRSSPQHVAEYLAIADLQRDLGRAAQSDPAALAELLVKPDATVRRLSVDPPGPPDDMATARTHRVRGHRWYRRWVALGATVVVIAGIALAGWRLFGLAPFTETITTQRAQTRSLLLPDGTELKLDADSSARLHFDRWRRQVVVTRGQAYFEVSSDRRPFSVVAGRVLIRDIGTAFNVYRQSHRVTVTVVHGHVTVWPMVSSVSARSGAREPPSLRPTKRSILPIASLGPGQQLRISQGHVLLVPSASLWEALAWTQNRITFDATPIGRVVDDFNRHNRTQIEVTDSALSATQISGTFEVHDVSAFVAFLRTLPGVRVKGGPQRVRDEVTP